MTKHNEGLRIKLIENIKSIESDDELEKIAKIIEVSKNQTTRNHIFKGIRKDISVETLKIEQNYKGIDRKEFDRIVKQLNIQEPIDELLALLN